MGDLTVSAGRSPLFIEYEVFKKTSLTPFPMVRLTFLFFPACVSDRKWVSVVPPNPQISKSLAVLQAVY